MTNDRLACGEQEALVAYLYDELAADERARFDAHLAQCSECTLALQEMRSVRAELAAWEVNTTDVGVAAGLKTRGYTGDGYAWAKTAGNARRGSARPWWAPGALAAAAVILLAVAAAIAKVEITYGSNGLAVRTGWSRGAAATVTATAPDAPSVREEAARAPQAADATVAATAWRDELAALEQRLRRELRGPVGTQNTASAAGNAQLLRLVQEMIEQSEVRQRRELALRLVQLNRDFDAQRQTDLVRIQQGLGQIEGDTAVDRQLLNYLVRTSRRQ